MSSLNQSIEAQKLAQKWIESKNEKKKKNTYKSEEKWEWKERKLYGGYE